MFFDSDQSDVPENEQSNVEEEEADSEEFETQSLVHKALSLIQKHAKIQLHLFGRTSTCLHVCRCRIRRQEHNLNFVSMQPSHHIC